MDDVNTYIAILTPAEADADMRYADVGGSLGIIVFGAMYKDCVLRTRFNK